MCYRIAGKARTDLPLSCLTLRRFRLGRKSKCLSHSRKWYIFLWFLHVSSLSRNAILRFPTNSRIYVSGRALYLTLRFSIKSLTADGVFNRIKSLPPSFIDTMGPTIVYQHIYPGQCSFRYVSHCFAHLSNCRWRSFSSNWSRFPNIGNVFGPGG